MKIFSTLYTKVMSWSKHRHAPYYLFCLSFAEAAFFPVPPDVMLAPMALAKPQSAWQFAALTTLASVLGGISGYIIGVIGFNLAQPYIMLWGYESTYLHIEAWFHMWGVWLMCATGFIPIPYILFTIAAGATKISILPFILSSIIGRGARYYLVALLMIWGGERMQKALNTYIDYIGWVFVFLVLIATIFWYNHSFLHLSLF